MSAGFERLGQKSVCRAVEGCDRRGQLRIRKAAAGEGGEISRFFGGAGGAEKPVGHGLFFFDPGDFKGIDAKKTLLNGMGLCRDALTAVLVVYFESVVVFRVVAGGDHHAAGVFFPLQHEGEEGNGDRSIKKQRRDAEGVQGEGGLFGVETGIPAGVVTHGYAFFSRGFVGGLR